MSSDSSSPVPGPSGSVGVEGSDASRDGLADQDGGDRPFDARGEVWTIVVAGGSGTRFGRPKQYEPLVGDERVIDRSMRVAGACSDGVVLVVPADDAEREGGVAGGETRSGSVRAGLAALPVDRAIEVVCVHDAARPLASPAVYERVIGAVLGGADAAIPGVAVADTIKVVDTEGRVVDTPDRSTLKAVQTPQAFRASSLRGAHRGGGEATDDAALVEALGGRVVVVEGEIDNRKVTVPDDLDWARRRVVELDAEIERRAGAAPAGDGEDVA